MPLIIPNRFYQPRGAFDPAAGGGGFDLSYQSSAAQNATTTSPINFGTLSYAAGATRTICVVQWYDGSSPGITSLTVGGQAFSQVSGAYVNSADKNVDVWISNAPLSGTSGAVVVTFTSNLEWASAVALYNLTTTTVAAGTPATIAVGIAASITAGPASIPSGGGALFATWPYDAGGAPTGSITSGNATIDASPSAGPGSTFYFGHTTATGSQSVTFTYSASTSGVATLVPWGP
jgi:hypothetical protein